MPNHEPGESAAPKRIQRKRVKGWRMPPNTVYVGRPTQWGKSEIAERAAREILKSPTKPSEKFIAAIVERAIAESQAWISVKEKLPPIGERVIVSIHGIGDGIGHKTRTTGLWNGEGWLRGSLERHAADESWPIKGEITHWQRLPGPPLSKGNGNV